MFWKLWEWLGFHVHSWGKWEMLNAPHMNCSLFQTRTCSECGMKEGRIV